VVLPIAATEQHGPHLPTGTDSLITESIVEQAAAIANVKLVVLPTIDVGSSDHHLPFGGTLSLTSQVFYEVLMQIGSSLASSGCKRLFIVNGHGGNHEVMQLVARDIALQQNITVACASWWALAYDALVDASPKGTRIPGHAGACETSLMLASHAALVGTPPRRKADAVSAPEASIPMFRRSLRIEIPGSWQQIDGFTDDPAAGSADLGRTYLEISGSKLAQAFRAFEDEAARSEH
jgi:creatinine amidohydrolase